VTATGAVAGSIVLAETSGSVVLAETSGSGIADSAGAATGTRDASRELSLAKPDDSVPQPPKAMPRTARTIRTGQTREVERTVPPLVLNFIVTFDVATVKLRTHARETNVKTDATPALFLVLAGMPGRPSSASRAEAKLFPV
jgi:hypothetical protein